MYNIFGFKRVGFIFYNEKEDNLMVFYLFRNDDDMYNIFDKLRIRYLSFVLVFV